MSAVTSSTLRSRVAVAGAAFATNAACHATLVEELRSRHKTVLAGGGASMAARHHARGKILVRDRIDLLVDPLTPFLELSPLAAWGQYGNDVHSAGIVTGIGVVAGTQCMIIATMPQ